jgi:hypothetical protein
MSDLSKVVTRDGLVRAFARWAEERKADPKGFKAWRDNPEACADYLLKTLRSVGGVATLGTAEGVGGRPVPEGLLPPGFAVRQPETPPEDAA